MERVGRVEVWVVGIGREGSAGVGRRDGDGEGLGVGDVV